MKTSSLRKGFTLVEIMIVVVIIGLLAALAIPAFKKVRNNAIEKSLINDARQISAAAQQYCSENADTQVSYSQIAKFLNGSRLSSGVMINTTRALSTVNDLGTATTTLSINSGEYFYLGHAQFDYTLSSNGRVTAAGDAAAPSVLKFAGVDGQPTP